MVVLWVSPWAVAVEHSQRFHGLMRTILIRVAMAQIDPFVNANENHSHLPWFTSSPTSSSTIAVRLALYR